MSACEQFPRMNLLEHGQDVHEWFRRLLSGEIERPAWALGITIPDVETARIYQTYHDCGKHLVASSDELGRRHFTGHAEASAELWDSLSDGSDRDKLIGRLIRHDMDAHTIRSESEIAEFIARPEAPLLLLTAVAECYSNANYLGKLGSDDFKIKLKRVGRIGKRYAASVAQWPEQEPLKLLVTGSTPVRGTNLNERSI